MKANIDAATRKTDMTLPTWRRLIPVAVLLLGLALFLLLDLERYFSFEMLSRHHATLTAWVAAMSRWRRSSSLWSTRWWWPSRCPSP